MHILVFNESKANRLARWLRSGGLYEKDKPSAYFVLRYVMLPRDFSEAAAKQVRQLFLLYPRACGIGYSVTCSVIPGSLTGENSQPPPHHQLSDG